MHLRVVLPGYREPHQVHELYQVFGRFDQFCAGVKCGFAVEADTRVHASVYPQIPGACGVRLVVSREEVSTNCRNLQLRPSAPIRSPTKVIGLLLCIQAQV